MNPPMQVAAYLNLHLRQIYHYTSFVISSKFASMEAVHQPRKFQQILGATEGTSFANDNLWIGRHKVGPRTGYAGYGVVVNPEQSCRSVTAIALPNVDKLPTVQGVERMGYSHKMHCGINTSCILN